MKNRIIQNICYALVLLFIIVLIYYVDFVASTNIQNINLALYISFPIVLYKMLKLNRVEAAFFWSASVYIICFPILIYYCNIRVCNEIDIYGGTITIAVITNKNSTVYNSSNIEGRYTTQQNIECAFYEKNSDVYNGRNVGDTILIVYSNKNVEWYKIYKWFPTHEEIQKYKDGIPFEPKKQKNK